MNYYIGADLGTSALKLLLADGTGKIVNSVSKAYDVCYPKPGWSEQKPADWRDAFICGTKELISGIDGNCVKGISVAGQMHGLVVLDKDDNIIRPAILWNDGRTDEETNYLNEGIGKGKLSEMTANIAFAGFTAPKLLWMQKNEPENFGKITKIMLPKDYINYCLTGIHTTDFSDASGFLLLDVKNKCWSTEMLEICGVTEEQMPNLKESCEFEKILPEMAELLGISLDCIVTAGAGDNAGAAIGTGTIKNGKCNISLGTSGTIFIAQDSFSVDKNNALHSFCHANGKYHLMGCILSAASCNNWFCEKILKTTDYIGEQSEIADEKLGRNNVYFLPYLMGERSPINDTDASGLFVGMRADTKRSDMVQAVLEGVAFAIRDNVEIAKAAGLDIRESTICGGGAKSEMWRKIMANVLNIDISTLTCEEGPGMGAVMLSMVACGEYKSIEACADAMVKRKDTINPDKELAALYEERYQKFKQIYPAVRELYKKLK